MTDATAASTRPTAAGEAAAGDDLLVLRQVEGSGLETTKPGESWVIHTPYGKRITLRVVSVDDEPEDTTNEPPQEDS